MSVTIGRLHVRTCVPKRLRAKAPDAARLAREVMPRAIASRLEGRLPSRPTVCRIRRLRVRVRVTSRELDEAHIADAWAEAFCRALLTAIHQPPEIGGVVTAESTDEWLADAVTAVLDGRRLSEFPLDEFAAYDGRAASDIVLHLVEDMSADWPAVLGVLTRRGAIDRLTSALGASGCRALVNRLSDRGNWGEPSSVEDLVRVAELFARDQKTFPSARVDPIDIIVLRVIAGNGGLERGERRFSPRALRSTLLALLWLANTLRDAAPSARNVSRDLEQGERRFSPRALQSTWLANALRDAAPSARNVSRDEMPPDVLADAPALAAVLRSIVDGWGQADALSGVPMKALRTLLPTLASAERNAAGTEAYESAVAGLFLLAPLVEHLDWPERVRRSSLGAQYGSRGLTYVLAGTAMALVGEAASGCARFDPGVAIFSGWLDAPDPSALARVCGQDVSMARDLVRDLAGGAVDADAIAGWDSAFAALGSRLVRRFAERLRGLGRSSERFLIERILAVPGTLVLDDRQVRVRLRSNTFWPVVHLSGADAPMDAVGWLGGRRLEFELEGL